MHPDEPVFQFDRPYSRGLATPTFSEGALVHPQAREGLVDLIRDAILRHYDPAEELARTGGGRGSAAGDGDGEGGTT